MKKGILPFLKEFPQLYRDPVPPQTVIFMDYSLESNQLKVCWLQKTPKSWKMQKSLKQEDNTFKKCVIAAHC